MHKLEFMNRINEKLLLYIILQVPKIEIQVTIRHRLYL